MKRKAILTIAMALCMCASMAGCGNSESSSAGSSSAASNSSAAESSQAKDEKPAEPTASAAFPTELSDNLYDYRVKLGDEVLTAPATLGQLENAGWVKTGSANTVLADKGVSVDFEKDNKSITVYLVNKGTESLTMDSEQGKTGLYTSSITVTSQLAKDDTVESNAFALPKGIETGATIEQVKAAYGEPAKTKEIYAPGGGNRNGFVYTYQAEGKKSYLELTFKPTSKSGSIAKEGNVSLQGVKVFHSTEDAQ